MRGHFFIDFIVRKVNGSVGVHIVEEPPGLVFSGIDASQSQEPSGVVSCVHHFGLNAK